jgi:hypothetical protein
MRNIFRNTIGAVAAGLFLFAALATTLVVPAMAQPNPIAPRSYSPRLFLSQQTHYERFQVNFNSCVYVSLVCSIKVGTLPYNAFVVRGYFQTTTTWNAGTSASIGVGTVTPAVNLVASIAVTTAGNMTVATIAPTGGGVSVTGNGIAQSGTLGGFDLFATITIVGALPTAGATTWVVEYIAPNDGNCIAVPLAATSPAC